MEPLVIRPNRRVFVVRPVMWTAILLGLVGVSAYLVLILKEVETLGVGLWVLVYVAIVGTVAGLRHVRYGKTSYTLLADRVVHRTGGLFSEATTDLQYRQITHVRLRLPFLEHRLFGTGRLTIMAAGSVLSTVVFEAIDEPRAIYDKVGALMKSQGFSLGRERMLHDERPNKVASLFDLGSSVTKIVGVVMTLVLTVTGLIDLIVDLFSLGGNGGRTRALTGLWGFFGGVVNNHGMELEVGMLGAFWGLQLIGLGGVLWTLMAMMLHYVDLTRRRYTLYEDVIDYADGFLTENYEFIPIENLSDVEINESLLKRALGVADVMLSCQGAGSQIRFTSMPEAQRFKASLEGLIEKSRGEQAEVQGVEEAPSVAPAEVLTANHAARQELRMHPLRALALPVGSLVVANMLIVLFSGVAIALFGDELGLGDLRAEIGLLLLVVLGLVVWQVAGPVVKVGIRVWATHYVVSNQKIESNYAFISKRQVEFTMERITGVVVRRGPLDRFFKTVTLDFSSIGSSHSLKFEHIADDGELVRAILARLRFVSKERSRSINANFGADAWVRAHLPVLLIAGLAFLGSFVVAFVVEEVFVFGAVAVLLLVVGGFAYEKVFYGRQQVEVFEDHIRVGQGVLIWLDYYLHFDHLKTAGSKQYIGATTGELVVHAANHAVGNMGYLEGVVGIHDWLDQVLHAHRRVDIEEAMSTALIATSAPMPRNTLLRRGPFALAIPVFLPGLIWRYIAVKRMSYRVEASRLVVCAGVFYKERFTILFDRIDHVRRTRGVVDKFSKTGAIEAYTVGSPMADVVLFDVPEDDALFSAIDERVGTS